MSIQKNILLFIVLALVIIADPRPLLRAQTKAGTQIINQGRVVFTYKSFPAETLKTNTVVFSVIGTPCYLSVAAEPKFLFGELDQDSARVTVTVEDTLHNAIQNNMDVECRTDLGTFSNGLQTIRLSIVNGRAETYLHSAKVQNDKKTATITASALKTTGETITAAAQVIMYPGAVTGIVLNGTTRLPFKGAVVLVTDQSASLVGSDTTKSDGLFFIALNKRVTTYRLRIIVVDNFGDTVVSVTEIDAATFPRPAIRIPNVIAGRIQYRENGRPTPAAGVSIYLDSIPRAQASGAALRRTAGLSSFRVAEQISDEKGRFKFENLPPAFYRLSIDSTKFQNYSGQRIIADTLAGTFTINVNIDVTLDSLIDVQMHARAAAAAGDTLRYSISTINSGNVLRFNTALVDTLPTPLKFVSIQKGTFASASFDTVSRIARWNADTLKIRAADSASIIAVLPRTIPDSTRIVNTLWLTAPAEPLRFKSTAVTVVRSQAVPSFSSYFGNRDSIAAGDSVIKVYTYRNTGTDSLRTASIVDTLSGLGKSVLSIRKKPDMVRVAVRDSIVTISIGSIAPGQSDTVEVGIVSDPKLTPGSVITARTHFLRNGTSLDQTEAVLPIADKRLWASLLKVMKTANKKVAEIGDVVTYQVQITNVLRSPLRGVGVYDLLPHAFTYVRNSARWNGKPFEPAVNPSAAGLVWLCDTMSAGATATLVYQCALGADALQSQGMNTVTAAGETRDGIRLVSEPSQWQVTVRPGVFTDKGLIIGKVFYDDNRNAFQEQGENGIRDVELWMEDGTRIITGDDGKFSIPEMKPGQHVLRVNERTLPAGTELMDGSNDFAKDPVSRFVRLTSGGIAKANFFVKRNTSDSLALTAVRAIRLAASRRAELIYRHAAGDTSAADTVEMNIAFAYKGAKYLQRIEVMEHLAPGFRYFERSARFNDRAVTPVIDEDSVRWSLGRGGSVFNGTLTYKAAIDRAHPAPELTASAVIVLMTADSITIASAPMATHTRAGEQAEGRTSSSGETVTFAAPSLSGVPGDTTAVAAGDRVMFETALRIDAHKKIASAEFTDTLSSVLAVDEQSFMLNGIPLQASRCAVRPMKDIGMVCLRASLDLTGLIRPGTNTVSYTALVRDHAGDTLIATRSALTAADEFGDRRTAVSKRVFIAVTGMKRAAQSPIPVIVRSDVPSQKKETVRTPVPVKNDTVRSTISVKKTVATRDSAVKPTMDRKPVPDETNRPDWLVYKRITGKYFVQISSWESEEKARAQAQRFMKKMGIETVLYEHYKNGRIYFAVQFGPYKTESDARASLTDLECKWKKKTGDGASVRTALKK
ncbi:MAG: SPOR domain-containing protein [Acidobacteriota bacterium]